MALGTGAVALPLRGGGGSSNNTGPLGPPFLFGLPAPWTLPASLISEGWACAACGRPERTGGLNILRGSAAGLGPAVLGPLADAVALGLSGRPALFWPAAALSDFLADPAETLAGLATAPLPRPIPLIKSPP
ncbi:MAG: hypothetical protein VKO21_02685 [Candidatus Sericytochromatia bacterium]|nr:hypothetical protein [Candidatus Sericytochromatia bacterium]